MSVIGTIDFLGPHDASVLGKPYSLRYEPHTSLPRTNFSSLPSQQTIEDVRGRESALSVHKNGFGLLTLAPQLSYDDFDDTDKVQTIFYKQVAQSVKEALGASRVQIFEHVVMSLQPLFYYAET